MPQIQAVKVVNGAGAAADSRGEPERLNPPAQPGAYETVTGSRPTRSSSTASAFHRVRT